MSRLSKLPIAAVLLLLNACTVAREEVRGTYDASKVILGATRLDIEDELGEANSDQSQPNSDILSIYRTSKVSKFGEKDLIMGKIVADAITLGLNELWNPFAVRDDTRAKSFAIIYSPKGEAKSIELTCYYDDGSKQSVLNIEKSKWAECSDGGMLGHLPISGK